MGAVLLLLLGCGGSQPHYETVGALRAAVFEADLAQVRSQAVRLEDQRPQGRAGEPGAGEALERLHGTLGFLMVSEDAEDVGVGLARLARACGDCHAATRARLPSPPSMPSVGSEGAHVRLQDRMWSVLVTHDGPAAQDLLQSMDPVLVPAGTGPEAALAHGRWMGAVEKAQGTCGLPEATPPTVEDACLEGLREVYATLAATCASCHRSSGVGS